jgi:hypothetical protein
MRIAAAIEIRERIAHQFTLDPTFLDVSDQVSG